MSTETNTKPVRFFLYARKSSESEDRQVQSIDDQVNRLKELAKRSNLKVLEILTEAKSAKKPGCRPVFTSMLERIERGEADGILCWQINRLFRNPVDSGAVGWMLQQGVLKSIQTIDRQYLPDDNVLLFSVESGAANQFIIDLRKNSKRGMDGKAERGWAPTLAPVGYLNDKLEHTIVEDKERFPAVRRMWDLMLTGNYTPMQVRAIANDEWGFRTAARKRGGGVPLSPSVVYKMFHNIFYTGMFHWDGQRRRGNHKPMITLEEFDRVQEILGGNSKPRAHAHRHAYTGIIHCAVCGGMCTATVKRKFVKKTEAWQDYRYYHCTGKKGSGCDQRKEPLTVAELEDQIEVELCASAIHPVFRQWALDILNRENEAEIADRQKVYEERHAALTRTQAELDNLTRMRYRDLIDDETFVRERDALKSQVATMSARLRETESRAARWVELTGQAFDFVTYSHAAFLRAKKKGDVDALREILAAIGQNFSLKDKKVLIEASEWLLPIRKAYPRLKEEYERLELDKSLTESARNAAFSRLILDWGAYRESNPNRRYHKPAC